MARPSRRGLSQPVDAEEAGTLSSFGRTGWRQWLPALRGGWPKQPSLMSASVKNRRRMKKSHIPELVCLVSGLCNDSAISYEDTTHRDFAGVHCFFRHLHCSSHPPLMSGALICWGGIFHKKGGVSLLERLLRLTSPFKIHLPIQVPCEF